MKLIRLWLEAGIIENGQYFPTSCGTPQGGVISPLLANIYLHVLDRYWQLYGTDRGKLVRYADDFVIVCRSQSQALQAIAMVKTILDKLKLNLHPTKTRIVKTEKEGFDFLGFHFHKCVSRRSGKLVPLAWPSTKAMKRIRSGIKEQTSSQWLRVDVHKVIPHLNQIIRGWRNYFSILNATRQFQSLDTYVWSWMVYHYRRRMGNRGSVKRDLFDKWLEKCKVERFYTSGKYKVAR